MADAVEAVKPGRMVEFLSTPKRERVTRMLFYCPIFPANHFFEADVSKIAGIAYKVKKIKVIF